METLPARQDVLLNTEAYLKPGLPDERICYSALKLTTSLPYDFIKAASSRQPPQGSLLKAASLRQPQHF